MASISISDCWLLSSSPLWMPVQLGKFGWKSWRPSDKLCGCTEGFGKFPWAQRFNSIVISAEEALCTAVIATFSQWYDTQNIIIKKRDWFYVVSLVQAGSGSALPKVSGPGLELVTSICYVTQTIERINNFIWYFIVFFSFFEAVK